MKRYRRVGGWNCLMTMAGKLSLVRLALAALSLWPYADFVQRLMAILLTLPADALGHYMMDGCGLATRASLALDAAADLSGMLALRILAEAKCPWLRIPADILLVLCLLGLIRRACRMKRTAV